jgi:TonB family protein
MTQDWEFGNHTLRHANLSSIMHRFIVVAGLLTAVVAAFGQASAGPTPSLPKEPREVFAATAPFYDFSAAELQPWHLKVSYQLYDQTGKKSDPGTYEYWWASPQEHRSTWVRGSVRHTDWYTADGKFAYEWKGDPLSLFEYMLQPALLSPLPPPTDLDPANIRLDEKTPSANAANGPCFTVGDSAMPDGVIRRSEPSPFSTYCFEKERPVLRSVSSFERVRVQLSDVVSTQGKPLARDVKFYEGDRMLLSAKVELIEPISQIDPELNPPFGASSTVVTLAGQNDSKPIAVGAGVVPGRLFRQAPPVYPSEAKARRIEGFVELAAAIGTDGKIHNLRVISAPSAWLANAAFVAVSQWEYKPYTLNGHPVPVEQTTSIKFAVGR